jgi:hypothetical protein
MMWSAVAANSRPKWRRSDMSDEPDLTCPTCGESMEVLTVEEGCSPSNLLRVCPFCATLAWNNEDGTIETRQPQAVEGEERDQLLRDRKFVSTAEELERLKRLRSTN